MDRYGEDVDNGEQNRKRETSRNSGGPEQDQQMDGGDYGEGDPRVDGEQLPGEVCG